MSEVNGFLNIIALLDGTTLNGRMRVEGSPLVQRYTKGSTQYVPDWSVSDKSKNPELVVIIRDSSSGAVMTVSSINWKYNGLTLTFGDDGLCTNEGLIGVFKKGTKQVPIDSVNYTVPSLKIMDNLASTDNVDNDTIVCSGKVKVDNDDIDFKDLSQEVLIEEATSSQVDVIIVSDSDFSIDSKTDTLTLSANVYNAGALDTETSYTYKWYSIKASGDVLLGSNPTLTVNESMVDSSIKIRCDVMKGDNIIGSGFTEVTDFSDPFYVQFNIIGMEGNVIKSGQTATITPKAINRDKGTEASVSTWNWKFKNNKGEDYNINGSSTLSALSASISYDNVKNAGKGMNIYVSAVIS